MIDIGPAFAIYLDEPAGRALIRGQDAKTTLVKLGYEPVWSVSGRGWVVNDLAVADDLTAYSGWCHRYSVVSRRRPT